MPTPQKNGICLFLMVIVYYSLTGTGSGFPPTSHIRLEKPTFVISPKYSGRRISNAGLVCLLMFNLIH